METTQNIEDAPARRHRAIGPRGTIARALVGGGCLIAAILLRVAIEELLIGLFAMPLIVFVALLLRGTRAAPLRLGGTMGHALNWGVGIAAFSAFPVPAFLFYGASMLLAAVRGYAGCELFAISNWLRRRDDQIVCPIFGPIDRTEQGPEC